MTDSTTNEIAKEVLRADAYELFLKGNSIASIANKLKIAPTTASAYVKKKQIELREFQNQDLIDARNTELARLDQLLLLLTEALVDAVDDFDLADGKIYRDGIKAKSMLVDRIQKTIDLRCKILGLYAPERIEQSVKEVQLTSNIDYENMELKDLEAAFAEAMRN